MFLIGLNEILHGYEIMTYSEYFVQAKVIASSTSSTLLSPDIFDLETLTGGPVIIDQGTENDCFTVESSDNSAEFKFSFPASFPIKGVVVIPRIQDDSTIA